MKYFKKTDPQKSLHDLLRKWWVFLCNKDDLDMKHVIIQSDIGFFIVPCASSGDKF